MVVTIEEFLEDEELNDQDINNNKVSTLIWYLSNK